MAKPKFSRNVVRGLREGAIAARRKLQIWGCDEGVQDDAREYERRARRAIAKGPLSAHDERQVGFARGFSAAGSRRDRPRAEIA